MGRTGVMERISGDEFWNLLMLIYLFDLYLEFRREIWDRDIDLAAIGI